MDEQTAQRRVEAIVAALRRAFPDEATAIEVATDGPWHDANPHSPDGGQSWTLRVSREGKLLAALGAGWSYWTDFALTLDPKFKPNDETAVVLDGLRAAGFTLTR
ncbi:MAG: hypothetical protein U0228_13140 [Myxococcaceae bacterium]